MNKIFIALLMLVFVFTVYSAPVTADAFSKSRELSQFTGEKVRSEMDLEPGDSAPPLPQQPPEAPVVDQPISGATQKVFCRISTDKIGNLEALCQKYGASMRIYWNYRNLVLMKKAACVVEAEKNNTYLLSKLYKKFNGKKIKKVQFNCKIWVYSAIHGVNATREEFKVGSFEELDVLLAKIVKKPYGPTSKVFRTLGKEFGDMVDSLAVVKKQYAGIGQKKKFLFNPTLDIEMIGVNMNGKGKNVTMFKETYLYKTIKRNKSYKWNK